MNLTELVNGFFQATSIKQKTQYALIWFYNPMLQHSSKVLAGQSVEYIHENVVRFLHALVKGQQEQILFPGYSITGNEKDIKALISKSNEAIVLWKAFGNESVFNYLSKYSIDDHGIKIQEVIRYYSSNPKLCLREDILEYLFKLDFSSEANTNIRKKFSLLDFDEDRHRLWQAEKMCAHVALGSLEQSHFEESQVIVVIYTLIFYRLLPININQIFALIDFTLRLQCINAQDKMKNKLDFVLEMLWVNLACMLKTISEPIHAAKLEDVEKHYKCNPMYMDFLLAIMGVFCLSNIKDKHQQSLFLGHYKYLLGKISSDQKLITPGFSYLQHLLDKSIPQFDKMFEDTQHRSIIFRLYDEFVEVIVRQKSQLVVAFLSNERYLQTCLLQSQRDQVQALELHLANEKIAHAQQVTLGASLTSEASKLRQELTQSKSQHTALQVHSTSIQQELGLVTERLQASESKEHDLMSSMRRLEHKLTSQVQDLKLEVEKLLAHLNDNLECLEPLILAVKLKIVITHTLLHNYKGESLSENPAHIILYLDLVLQFSNFVFTSYKKAVPDSKVKAKLAEIQADILHYDSGKKILVAYQADPTSHEAFCKLRLLYQTLMELRNTLNYSPLDKCLALHGVFKALWLEFGLTFEGYPLFDNPKTSFTP